MNTASEASIEKKSWRQFYEVHLAAKLFPGVSEDELRSLGEDIKKNGLKESITLWSMKPEESESAVILDGCNRLDAMELVGIETVKPIGDKYRLNVGMPVSLLGEKSSLSRYRRN